MMYKLLKEKIPAMVCAVVPFKINEEVPALNVPPEKMKFPFIVSLVEPALNVVPACIVKLPLTIKFPESDFVPLPAITTF